MNPTLRLRVVLVSHKSCDVLLAALRALLPAGLGPELAARTEVVVVDSASGDDTLQQVQAAFPAVRTIACRDNVGFARGCNLGLHGNRAEYVLFLNPDTLVPAGAIAELVAWLDSHPRTAACGPRLSDGDGRAAPTGQRFPTPWTELSRQWEPVARALARFVPNAAPPVRSGPVDWLSGACLLVRSSVLQQIGGFDERYFLYFEETDWCLRARAAGHDIDLVTEVAVEHQGGVSARRSGQRTRNGLAARAYARSRWSYFRRWHGYWGAVCVEACHRSRELALRLHLVEPKA